MHNESVHHHLEMLQVLVVEPAPQVPYGVPKV